MNYRHAFHAGNFADVMKHALLTRILVHLLAKETPFRVVDTHAGIGLYDLAADEAGRTGEWEGGVARLREPFAQEVEALLEPYRRVLGEVRARHGDHAYPGSPAILREMLRRQDRAILVELHPADGALLSERYNGVANMKVLRQDGWMALRALIPPREKRGLVLVDPPFEERGELERMVRELVAATAKWPSGIYAGWYPVKHADEIDAAARLFSEAPRPVLRLELMVDRPDDPARLNGCGLFVVNPPWTLKAQAEALLPAFAERLSRAGYGAFRCEHVGTRPS